MLQDEPWPLPEQNNLCEGNLPMLKRCLLLIFIDIDGKSQLFLFFRNQYFSLIYTLTFFHIYSYVLTFVLIFSLALSWSFIHIGLSVCLFTYILQL